MEEQQMSTSSTSTNDENGSFTVKKLTLWKSLTGVFGVLFILAFFNVVDLGESGTTGAMVAPSGNIPDSPTPTAAPTLGGVMDIDYDGAYIEGDEDAPVTIVEFSDFQCPYCGRFYTETLGQIRSQYVDTGKVKIAFKHLPLSFHPYAQGAAEAAECAGDQGMFWEYHDTIFENQALLSDSIHSTWAEELGLDVDEFEDCMDSGKYTSKVQGDLSDASAYGATGTPTFFINGKKLVGAQPFSAFQAAIEAEL